MLGTRVRRKTSLSFEKSKFLSTDLPNILTSKPGKLRGVINPQPSQPLSLADNDGSFLSDNDCANLLNDLYCCVSTNETLSILPKSDERSHPSMNLVVIDVPGLPIIIDNLKECPRSGDNLMNSKLLRSTELPSIFIRDIFGQSHSPATILADWKHGGSFPFSNYVTKIHRPIIAPFRSPAYPGKSLNIQDLPVYSLFLSCTISFIYVVIPASEPAGIPQVILVRRSPASLSSRHSLSLRTRQTNSVFFQFSKAFDRVPHHHWTL